MTPEDTELVRKTHWKHLQQAARRHAKERGERMMVLGQRWEFRGYHGWHYVIMPPTHPIVLARERREVTITPATWARWLNLGAGLAVRAFGADDAYTIHVRETPSDLTGEVHHVSPDELSANLGQWVRTSHPRVEVMVRPPEDIGLLHVRRVTRR